MEKRTINIIAQGKGGVGKTFVSTQIAQFYLDSEKESLNIDTDPVNSTFASFEKLNVKHIDLLLDNNINPRKFDEMMELIFESEKDVVIDNGASSFIPLLAYFIENNVFEIFKDMGAEINFHTIIMGGQSLQDTLNGLHQISERIPDYVNLIVWLNEYNGQIEMDGKGFESFKLYKQLQDRIQQLIFVEQRTRETFGEDVKKMLEAKKIYNEILSGKEFGLMQRQRIKTVQKSIYDQLRQFI
ncbi:TPA: ArsA-related P-loop ATPase [Acinetobacter nosocomialis]|uniref:IncP-type DNA transfer protein TraL n=3 Tax=Acinetobacter TaxID=469 RepID=A0A1B2RCU3_ACIBA|nr:MULTISPECIES: ArsA-related P-loop ATPase [Acinetobacter]UNW08277.1 AAA family ATPase [Acinetobacter variabilis]AOB42344.1 IncP-type DNA transfer protein TraL [Acinetobacter baumannii]AUF80824.1 IncP-type DNA transfer protein TraL [Acinetobacter pittii]MDP1318340.1 ArsA-related P-loop ATPase [Acinetobacter lwoffii]MDP1371181.1 ArsA-related P-loop ATPase [Acinetobacter lwoffii]